MLVLLLAGTAAAEPLAIREERRLSVGLCPCALLVLDPEDSFLFPQTALQVGYQVAPRWGVLLQGSYFPLPYGAYFASLDVETRWYMGATAHVFGVLGVYDNHPDEGDPERSGYAAAGVGVEWIASSGLTLLAGIGPAVLEWEDSIAGGVLVRLGVGYRF